MRMLYIALLATTMANAQFGIYKANFEGYFNVKLTAPVVFVDEIPNRLSENAVGKYYKDEHIIRIKQSAWEKANKALKYYLFYHEALHSIGVGHHKVGIMRTAMPTNTTEEYSPYRMEPEIKHYSYFELKADRKKTLKLLNEAN